MNRWVLFTVGLSLISTSALGRTPRDALFALLDSSSTLRARAFIPRHPRTHNYGWASHWYRRRFGQGFNHWDYSQQMKGITDTESDKILHRILAANEGNQILFELREHGGNYVDRIIWGQFFRFQGGPTGANFNGITPREALTAARPVGSTSYSSAFRNGAVVRRQSTIYPEGDEFVVRLKGEDVLIERILIDAREFPLTTFEHSSGFVPTESGLGAVGNRFLVGLENPNMLFFNRGSAIEVFQYTAANRGFSRLDFELIPARSKSSIVAMTDSTELSGSVFGVIKEGKDYHLAVWNPHRGNQTGGPTRPQVQERLLHDWLAPNEGNLIVGIRLSHERGMDGNRLVAIDYLTAEREKALFFKPETLKPAEVYQF